MLVMGNLIWNSAGSVSALFRVPEGTGGLAALVPALAALRCPSKLATIEARGVPENARWVLSVEVGGGGMAVLALAAAGAATAAFLRPFGLASPCPGPRLAAAQHAAADRLVSGLTAFQLAEPSAAEIRSALDDSAYGWREVRCCGYAAGTSDGRPKYRACFVAMPLGATRVEWPLSVSCLPAAAWCLCVQPSRAGAATALLARIVAGDPVRLGERAAALRRAVRERGWDLIRPGSGQALLAAAMAPGASERHLPRSLFFPLPHASSGPALELAAARFMRPSGN